MSERSIKQAVELDRAIWKMNESVNTAIVSILNGITKMVDDSVAETLKNLTPDPDSSNNKPIE